MRFRVVAAGRNHAAYTEECVRSVITQMTRANVVCDWTDDASDDGPEAYDVAKRILGIDRAKVSFSSQEHYAVRRVERVGGLCNWWRAVQRAAEDDVLVFLGGDDYLEPGALARVYREYNEDRHCWVTYGSMHNVPDGRITNICEPWEPPYATRPPKTFMWVAFTCRAWLAKKILERDLKLAGSFFMSSGDAAFTTPIVEMAGPEHVRLIKEKWYARRIQPGNDGWVDPGYQHYCTMRAYMKPHYSRVSGPDDTPTRSGHVLPYGLIVMPNEPFPRFLDLADWRIKEVEEGRVPPVDWAPDFRKKYLVREIVNFNVVDADAIESSEPLKAPDV